MQIAPQITATVLFLLSHLAIPKNHPSHVLLLQLEQSKERYTSPVVYSVIHNEVLNHAPRRYCLQYVQ